MALALLIVQRFQVLSKREWTELRLVPNGVRYRSGRYLSLLKYTAFIDPLIRDIERSGHGCCIAGIPTSPL